MIMRFDKIIKMNDLVNIIRHMAMVQEELKYKILFEVQRTWKYFFHSKFNVYKSKVSLFSFFNLCRCSFWMPQRRFKNKPHQSPNWKN